MNEKIKSKLFEVINDFWFNTDGVSANDIIEYLQNPENKIEITNRIIGFDVRV